jgi:hypothetical protein
MNAWPLNASPTLLQQLYPLALACGDIWNMALQQRRNKYAWGKADFRTQAEEIISLQSEDPELAGYPTSSLTYPVWLLDQQYQTFLHDLACFKRKQRATPPILPQAWPAEQPFPIYLAATAFERRGEVGLWYWPVSTVRLPLGKVPAFTQGLLHLDAPLRLEALEGGP